MKTRIKATLALSTLLACTSVLAQITFFEHQDFGGRSFTGDQPIPNFERYGFNDRASSVIVEHDRWEVCTDAGFSGRCIVLRPGRYPSLAAMGLNDKLSSSRSIGRNEQIVDGRYAPMPPPVQAQMDRPDFHRRRDERLFEADVTAVHAVVGPPEQRCWIEREQVQVQPDRGDANVNGAVAGALIGGILGHQIGSGGQRGLTTAGGAVAGAVIGSNIGRDNGGPAVATQDVRRCERVRGQERPDYWDVTYVFRGQEHRMQTTAPPGPTVTVNRDGEPRH